jgi:hypothetical protein
MALPTTTPTEKENPMPENTLANALKYAATNPNLEEAKGDFLKPEDDKPAMDDEKTGNLVTMFSSVCKAFAIDPKDALTVLNAQDWGDDLSNLGNRFRQGF